MAHLSRMGVDGVVDAYCASGANDAKGADEVSWADRESCGYDVGGAIAKGGTGGTNGKDGEIRAEGADAKNDTDDEDEEHGADGANGEYCAHVSHGVTSVSGASGVDEEINLNITNCADGEENTYFVVSLDAI